MHVVLLTYSINLLKEVNNNGDNTVRMRSYAEDERITKLTILVKGKTDRIKLVSDKLSIESTRTNSAILSFFILLYKVIRINGENKIDILGTQDPNYTGILGLLLYYARNIKYSVCVYGTNPFDRGFIMSSFYNKLFKSIFILVLKKASVIQVDGLKALHSIQDELNPKIFYKPMFPEVLCDMKLDVSVKPRTEVLSLLYVGRFATQKNLKLFVRTVNALKCRGIKVIATMIGSGPEKKTIKDYVRTLDLAESFNFKDQISHDEVLESYGNSDLLLMTSYFEGYPRVFMEALANGLPIVSTDVGGVKEAIQDGLNGFVVTSFDEEQLADCCIEVKNNHETFRLKSIERFQELKNLSYINQIDIWLA